MIIGFIQIVAIVAMVGADNIWLSGAPGEGPRGKEVKCIDKR